MNDPADSRSRSSRLAHVALAVHLLFIASAPTHAPAQPFGIETRAPNTSLVIPDLPPPAPGEMWIGRIFPRVNAFVPVQLLQAPDTRDRIFVVQQDGLVKTWPRVFDPAPAQVSTYLNLANRIIYSGERGLLSIAFDPDFATNGDLYAMYSSNTGSPAPTRIARYRDTAPADNFVDPATEAVILDLPQPGIKHKGGMLAFGPDGMLYVAVGDGAGPIDPEGHGQDTRTLLGSILRLDPGATSPGPGYAVPVDNPFVAGGPAGLETRPEIWAYGFRNPWRMSFDTATGLLYVGDVGLGTWEEVDVVRAGENYGWAIMEGAHCLEDPCDPTGLTLPIAEYDHTVGLSITGGFVYHSTIVPELEGVYLYGDYLSGVVHGLTYDPDTDTVISGPNVIIPTTGFFISAFGQDATGEVYLLDYSSGAVYVIRRAGGGSPAFPHTLSDMPALLAAGRGQDQTAAGILPYEPISPLWSDGALKERFLALPGTTQIGYTEAAGWNFPEQTALVKNFLLPRDLRDPVGSAQRIETRLLYRKNGVWHGFSYKWNDAQTDAILLATGEQRSFEIVGEDGLPFDYEWTYPSRTQCQLCHTAGANDILGLTTPQMNHAFDYPASGVTDNQLRTFEHIGLFEAPLPAPPDALPRLTDPADTTAPVAERARSYMAANCAQCHRPGGATPVDIDLRWEITEEQMMAIHVAPMAGDLGLENAQIIAPGAPERSVLHARMNRRGPAQMPPLATSRIDAEGVALIEQYIQGLLAPPTASGLTLH